MADSYCETRASPRSPNDHSACVQMAVFYGRWSYCAIAFEFASERVVDDGPAAVELQSQCER